MIAAQETIARWRSFERTKYYDLALAFPLVAFYSDRLWERLPDFRDALSTALAAPDLLNTLQLISEIGVFAFVFLVIVMLILRVPPVAKAKGLMPRIAGFIGTFATLLYLAIEPVDLSLPWQIAATVLSVVGSLFGAYCVFWLGRSFSIMAEARLLRTRGAYAFVRHPLYLAEEFIVASAAIQYRQPWAILIALVQLGFQLWRIRNEEAVLRQTFPEYDAYAAKTARLLPGLW
ncbi:MAG: methyltransferase family protein [Rhizomicrobium sp.]